MTDFMTAPGDGPFGRLPALPSDGYATHEVMNQATPFTGHNAFTGDRLLGEIARREKIGWADRLLADAGSTVASPSSRATTASATASTRSTSIRRGTS